MVVEMASKEEARAIIPPIFHSQARVVTLNSFTLREIEGMLREHEK